MSATKRIQLMVASSFRQGDLVSKVLDAGQELLELSSYYPNNHPRFCYTLKNGRLHGVGRTWYENGQLEREEPLHKSVLHGRERLWYPHGVLRAEKHYVNDQLDGARREWYPSGQMKIECHYVMNRLDGLYTEWHPKGQLKERVPYWEGEPHGIIKRFDEKGRASAKEIYVRGLPYGGRIKRLLNEKRFEAKRLARIGSPAIRRFLLEEIGYARLLAEGLARRIDQDGDSELFE